MLQAKGPTVKTATDCFLECHSDLAFPYRQPPPQCLITGRGMQLGASGLPLSRLHTLYRLMSFNRRQSMGHRQQANATRRMYQPHSTTNFIKTFTTKDKYRTSATAKDQYTQDGNHDHTAEVAHHHPPQKHPRRSKSSSSSHPAPRG